MDNKVFFQHPDLMRALCLHETVMQLMVNTLNKAQQQQSAAGGDLNISNQRRQSTVQPGAIDNNLAETSKVMTYNRWLIEILTESHDIFINIYSLLFLQKIKL